MVPNGTVAFLMAADRALSQEEPVAAPPVVRITPPPMVPDMWGIFDDIWTTL